MKNLLKITLVAGIAATAIVSVPVSAGNQFPSLRGTYSPQPSILEFEGRFDQSAKHITQRQHRRLKAATRVEQPQYQPSQYQQSQYQPANYASNSYVNAPQDLKETVTYYSAEEYYGRQNGNSLTPSQTQNTSWQQRRLQGNGSAYQAPKRKKSKFGNIYDYESGNCGKDCGSTAPAQIYYQPAPQTTYRTQITGYQCWNGEVVSDPQSCAKQTKTVSIPQFQCWDGEIVTDANGCKLKTITKEVYVSQPSTSSQSFSSNSFSSSSSTAPAANCPSGTSKQSDGTCLQSSAFSDSSFSSGSYPTASYGSGSNYSSSSSLSNSSSISSYPTNCPSGTTAQSDGTCLEGAATSYNSFAGSSIEIFDNNTDFGGQTEAISTPFVSTPSYGFNTDNSYGLRSYLPIRK